MLKNLFFHRRYSFTVNTQHRNTKKLILPTLLFIVYNSILRTIYVVFIFELEVYLTHFEIYALTFAYRIIGSISLVFIFFYFVIHKICMIRLGTNSGGSFFFFFFFSLPILHTMFATKKIMSLSHRYHGTVYYIF